MVKVETIDKVVCPVCGKEGYLRRITRDNGLSYLYVYHRFKEGDKVKYAQHYVGKDTERLREEIEKLIEGSARKVVTYAGGDYFIADELLRRIDGLCMYEKCTFVEVFGGSGYISQNVNRAKFANIIYNDINSFLVKMFKAIKENPEKLAFLVSLLPYSRSYRKIIEELVKKGDKTLAELEAAALFFYYVNLSYMGATNKKGFALAIEPTRNMAKAYRKRAKGILEITERWKDVTIENYDFRKILQIYDSEKTVFYLDPPYPDRAEEYYGTEFTVKDLREMAVMLTKIKGKFLLKLDDITYNFIKDILPATKYKVEVLEKVLNMDKKKGEKRDTWKLVLVSNPNPDTSSSNNNNSSNRTGSAPVVQGIISFFVSAKPNA